MKLRHTLKWGAAALSLALPSSIWASEADINIPDLKQVIFFNGSLSGTNVLMIGLVVCLVGMIYGWMQYVQTRNLPVHSSMAAVSQINVFAAGGNDDLTVDSSNGLISVTNGIRYDGPVERDVLVAALARAALAPR